MKDIKFLAQEGVDSEAFQKAKPIRKQIFVLDQQSNLEDEFDDIDHVAYHFIGLDENNDAICCARAFEKDGAIWIGRFAVKQEYRGQKIATRLFKWLEDFIIANLEPKVIAIHAQKYIQHFYASFGYEIYGDEDMEGGIEHVYLKKVFDK